MRSLLVTKFVPLPANTGGRQRTLATLDRLLKRGPVTICAFDDGQSDTEGLRRRGVEVMTAPWPQSRGAILRGALRTGSLSAGRFRSEPLVKAVRQAARASWPLDLLYVEYSQLVPYGHGIPARLRVLDLHNIESDLTFGYAARRGFAVGAVLRAEALALRRLERVGLNRFHLVSVVSERDRAMLDPDPAAEIVVCRNGCQPIDELAPATDPVAAFVATLSWAPNVDAALWFTHKVWPLVRSRLADARLLLVGRDPTEDVRGLSDDFVTVTGTVPSVTPYLTDTRVALAPLHAGGGSRLKILEALMAGRPVVSTTVGASGLEDLIGRGVVIADEPAEMAARLVALLDDPEAAQRLGMRGREAVLSSYSWDSTLAPMIARLPG